jgi:hypothetical protein
MAGPVVMWIVGALENAVVVLFSAGIPKDSVVQYELAVKTDKYLLMVHGTPSAVEQGERNHRNHKADERGEAHGRGDGARPLVVGSESPLPDGGVR